MTLVYPCDRLRGTAPDAPAWSVVRGSMPGSYHVATDVWASQPSRYAPAEIVASGLTRDAAEAMARGNNVAWGESPPVKSGGRG